MELASSFYLMQNLWGFLSPAANKLDMGIKNEPLKEQDLLHHFALAAHWVF